MSTKRGADKKGHKGDREAWLEKLRFLSDAMESTSQPFAAGGPEGSTMIFNEAFCRLTGYTREELYRLNWATDLTTPESRINELEVLDVLDRTREPQRYEKYYRRKDGTVIPIELLAHVALDSQGNILFYYSFITDISERKRNEAELRMSRDRLESAVEEKTADLRRSEEHLKRMIEASPVPMVVYEENRNYFLNEKFVETFGYTIEDIPSVNEWWPLAYPDENYRNFVKKRWYVAVDEAVKNKTSIVPQEAAVTCKDGTKKDVSCYFSSIGDLNLAVFYNLTERKRAEEALRESEERYRPLFEHMLNGFAYCKMLYDEHGNPEDFIYLAVNGAFGRLTGLENVVGKRATEAIPGIKESHPELFDIYSQVATTGKPERFEIEFKPLAAWLSVSVYSTRQGYFTALFENITEHKRAEEALRESEEIARQRAEELEKLMDVVPAAIWVSHDPDCRVIVGNRTANRFYEAEASENVSAGPARGDEHDLTRRFFRDGRELKPEELPMQEAVSRNIDVKNAELDVLLPSGRLMTILGNAIPLHDAKGNVRGSVAAFVDITRRKRAEEEAKAAKAQAELYLDLMGHDISNMHQIAMGYLELAQDILQLEQGQRELIDQPAEVLRRSARLISNVRKLRQHQEGLFQCRTIDICAVLADVCREFGAVPGKNITLSLGRCDSCQVRANELLHDVFANLVSNAIKHTGSRAEIRINVERAEDTGGPCHMISVEDNGPGIPDDFKDKVFNRLLESTMRVKGMGLGLYFVKSLVDSYGGKVWVEDRVPGNHTKGARFVVMLPAVEK